MLRLTCSSLSGHCVLAASAGEVAETVERKKAQVCLQVLGQELADICQGWLLPLPLKFYGTLIFWVIF